MLCDCSGANCTITRACTVPNGGRPSSRAANSSRMPPSQPRAPPRSRALACGPRGDRRGATVTEGELPLAATRSLTRLPRAARPPEAAISDAWARSWPAFLHDWHRVARADCVTLVLGAVCNPHAWLNAWLKALRGGACRNPGQGNSGGQDESDETHGGTSLWVGLLRLERRSCANVVIVFAYRRRRHCEAVHTGRFFV